jgi:predicted Zn-dependent protease
MADGSSSGWAGQPSTKLSDIHSASLAATASEKCARWKNPQKIEPGNYTVVLEPTAAADIVRLMAGAFSARNTEEGRTFLSKRGGGTLLGEKVFPDFVTLRSDPFDSRQPSSPWTADQLPTRAIKWVDKGVIANLASIVTGPAKLESNPPRAPAVVSAEVVEEAVAMDPAVVAPRRKPA